MDALVTRYSRPAALQRETHHQDSFDDAQDDMAPSLSLKFAMPPVAQVSHGRPGEFLPAVVCRCSSSESSE